MKMQVKYIITLFIALLIPLSVYGDRSGYSVIVKKKSVNVNQELGYTTTGSNETHTTTSRCTRHQTVGAMTVSHGWSYTSDYQTNDSDTVTLAVYDDAPGPLPGIQNGDCSSTATITNNAFHWEEVTFSGTQPSLIAGTYYWICQYVNGDIGTDYEATGGTETYETDTSCPGGINDSASVRQTPLTVANYDAR